MKYIFSQLITLTLWILTGKNNCGKCWYSQNASLLFEITIVPFTEPWFFIGITFVFWHVSEISYSQQTHSLTKGARVLLSSQAKYVYLYVHFVATDDRSSSVCDFYVACVLNVICVQHCNSMHSRTFHISSKYISGSITDPNLQCPCPTLDSLWPCVL